MPSAASVVDIRTLSAELDRLIAFGRRFPHPAGGAAWLDDRGHPDLSRPIHTWITARMAHVYCLSHLLGVAGAAELADHALAGLTGLLRDRKFGGWYSSVMEGNAPDEKGCYAHAFVVLAASSAVVAGRPEADRLLNEALDMWHDRFWDPAASMFVDRWNRSFTSLDPYRGVNGNMHAVEALLAAGDVTADPGLHQRALAIAERVVGNAREHGWRIPEHFDAQWRPQLEHNRDHPDDPFQPFGATVGHAYEWSRLLLHLHASITGAPIWLSEAAIALFDRGVTDGWAADGEPGFVYTTDWDGRPVVRDRMHWVAAEAISAGAALYRHTDEVRYAELCRRWWDYIERFLIDREAGSWHHQLDAKNRPIATVWPGKPDLYHAVQATLIPRLPLAPSLASAIAAAALT
jgi:sulfoquinovose isomerase